MKKIKTVFGIFLMMLLVLWLTPAVNITAKAASYTSLQVDDHLAVYDQISYGSASLKFGNIEGLTELSSGTLTLRTGNYNSGTNSYTVAYSTDGNYYVFVDQANTVYGLSNRGAFKEDLSEGLEVQSVENGVITFAPYLPSHTLTYKYDSDNPQYPDYVVNDANKRSKALTSMPAGWIAPEGKVLCGWLFHNATWGETALGAPISITKDGIYATPLWVESYGLWVGDTAVTKNKKSDYGWSYDPDSNTLTLNNFFYSGVGHNDNAENPHYGGIYYDGEDPLKIQISGNNSIENTHTANLPCGIYSTKDVTINGTGTLEIVASSYTKSQGIWCDQAAFTQNSGNIVMRTTSNGIYAKKGAQINGGSLDVYGNYGITGDEKNYKLVIGSDVESVVISGEGKATDFPVINALKGTGWTDKDGTQGEADIEISTTGQALTYKKVQFLPAKSMATVVKEPTAKADLTENGSAQELVTAGTADGGTMQYALGTDAKTAPTDGYSTAIPTGTKAGNYYVWYKVAGDDSHKDSDPACIEVKIKETNNDSTIETKVEKKDDVPEANVEGLDSELA
ncbi:hypothetical protein SAMN04487770_11272, partial [Butyrivibrio sp. ob235]|uniref:hypothetical protein n=1 Tax=Butyrivibrio sp. ob235 TaxID=1761780 RepID=UPI0008BDE719